MHRCRRIRSGVLIVLALLVACSSANEEDVGAPPMPSEIEATAPAPVQASQALPEPDTLVECGRSSTFPASALDETVPLEEADVPAMAVAPIEEFLATGEGDFWPQDGYRVLHQTTSSLLLVRVDGDGNTVLLGSALVGGGWQTTDLSSGGPCPIRIPLPQGLHEVDWRLEPDQVLDQGASEFTVLATGQACSSGQPMGDRLQPPTLLLTNDAVFLSLTAEQPGGAQTCPGNPEELVMIAIGAPLGDRDIADGRTAAGLISDYVPAS